MNLVDTHAHLYWDSFQEDLDQILKRAQKAGLTYIINIGVDVEKSQEALDQAQKLSTLDLQIFSSVAIHPEEANKYTSNKLGEDIAGLEAIYRSDPKTVVAIGECGLDFLPQWVPTLEAKELQRQLFQAQIDLAKKLNLPLLVHCRDDRSKDPNNSEAWDLCIKMTKDHFGIYHCYSGLPQTTNYLLQTTNFLVSFAGNLTYPQNEYLREAVKLIPLDRIVLETDCPFLPPQSKRGQRNEPAFVLEVAKVIAEIKETTLLEIGTKTSQNVGNLLSNVQANTL